ncbi:MAG: hypothetical protein IKY90_07130 [Oscillospiraceae bacterium]|nr:hypothetical protein [Oscillospiraceae bacterium]
MYTIYVDDKLLFDSTSEDVASIVLSPKLSLDVNKPGSLSFVVPPGNARHGQLKKLKSIVVVKQGSTVLFRGRVLETETDFYNQQTVYCEGDKAFLMDSLCEPYTYSGTVRGLFQKLVQRHNANVNSAQKLTLGVVTVDDADEPVEVESDAWSSTYSEIENRLLNVYGGYLRTRTVSTLNMIDWVKDYVSANTHAQPIEFSVNLLDLSEKVDASEVFTCLIPLGASEIGEDGEYLDPVSIESVNNGKNYIQDFKATTVYGQIWRTHTWSYETDPAKLLEKAEAYLATGVALETLTLKAIDMNFISGSVSVIRIGSNVHILSNPHGIDRVMLCSQMEIDLLNPENTVYTFGERPRTLSENIVKAEEDLDVLRGGGGAIKKEVGEVKTWAQVTVNEQQANINMIAWDINDITNRQSQAEINIDGMQAAITLKADRSIVDEIESRVSSAEIAIDAANSKINLLTSNEEVNNLHKRVSQAELAIDAANARIDLIVDGREITDLVDRVGSAEIRMNGLEGQINLKASSETVTALSDQVNLRDEQIEGHEMRLIDTERRVGNAEIAINAANARIDMKADLSITNSLSERVSNAEIAIDAANARIDFKADLTVTNELSSRVNRAEIDINAAHARIDMKADSDLVDQYGRRISKAEVNIDGLNAKIELKASKDQVDEYGERLGKAEASIVVNSDSISSKVSKNGVISAINQTAEEIKIQASKINLEGYVTASQLSAEIAAIKNIFGGTTTVEKLNVSGTIMTTNLDVASNMKVFGSYTGWDTVTLYKGGHVGINSTTSATVFDFSGNPIGKVSGIPSGFYFTPSSNGEITYLAQAEG